MKIRQILGTVVFIEAMGYVLTGKLTHEIILEAIKNKSNNSSNKETA